MDYTQALSSYTASTASLVFSPAVCYPSSSSSSTVIARLSWGLLCTGDEFKNDPRNPAAKKNIGH